MMITRLQSCANHHPPSVASLQVREGPGPTSTVKCVDLDWVITLVAKVWHLPQRSPHHFWETFHFRPPLKEEVLWCFICLLQSTSSSSYMLHISWCCTYGSIFHAQALSDVLFWKIYAKASSWAEKKIETNWPLIHFEKDCCCCSYSALCDEHPHHAALLRYKTAQQFVWIQSTEMGVNNHLPRTQGR